MIEEINEAIIRPIHYLGSKMRMLDIIKTTVSKLNTNNDTICDLFAGSGTVTSCLLSNYDVISVDIQNYSKIICSAISSEYNGCENVETIMNEINQSPLSNQLDECMEDLIIYEKKAVNDVTNSIKNLYEIIECGAIYPFQKNEQINCSKELSKIINKTINNFHKYNLLDSKETVISRYYGGVYFSYQQAVTIDKIANLAFQKGEILKQKIIAALLTTTSEIVNTVGKQFAQPLKVRDKNGNYKKSLLKKILNDREIDIYQSFKENLSFYLSTKKQHKNTFICDDYKSIWERLKKENVSVVYADPPYTRYHYSRYYHILETISLRDIPDVTTTFANGKGGLSRALYRAGRHQSPFCIKSQVEDAFIALFSGVSSINANLILSYSPFDPSKAVSPRLQTIEQLITLAERYYNKVEIISPGKFVHSKLNKKENNLDVNDEAELLLVCTEIKK